jgi:hypothetical protein
MRTDDPKPELFLVPGSSLTFERVMALYASLTGREPSPEALAEARRLWDAETDGADAPTS